MQLPGIVFARGGAVAILMLLESESGTYAVLTEQVGVKYAHYTSLHFLPFGIPEEFLGMLTSQARVPVGRVLLELPAGMLDDDVGDFIGTAAREVVNSFESLTIPEVL